MERNTRNTMPINLPSGNINKINNKMKTIENVNCKEYYLHSINKDGHTT